MQDDIMRRRNIIRFGADDLRGRKIVSMCYKAFDAVDLSVGWVFLSLGMSGGRGDYHGQWGKAR